MIAKLEKTKKWTFSYLGATPDAVDIAKGLNIREQNAMRYEQKDVKRVFARYSNSLDNYIMNKSEGIINNTFLIKDEEEVDEHKD